MLCSVLTPTRTLSLQTASTFPISTFYQDRYTLKMKYAISSYK